MTRRETILATARDLVSDFTFYDRKEDEELSADELEAALAAGEVTPEEIVAPLLEWCRGKAARS